MPICNEISLGIKLDIHDIIPVLQYVLITMPLSSVMPSSYNNDHHLYIKPMIIIYE